MNKITKQENYRDSFSLSCVSGKKSIGRFVSRETIKTLPSSLDGALYLLDSSNFNSHNRKNKVNFKSVT